MDILGLASVAVGMMAQPVTRHSHGAGEYSGPHDEWEEGTVSTDTIQAVINTPQGKDVQNLPEGIRSDVEWMIWTTAELNEANEESGKEADEIEWQGERFAVLHIWPRREGGYTKAALGIIRDRGRSV